MAAGTKTAKLRLLGHIFTHNATHKAGFPLSSFTATFFGALTSSSRCRLVARAFVGYLPTPYWVHGPSSTHLFGFAASFFGLNGRVSVDFFYHNALSGACIAAVLRTGVAGCPIKNESPILTETNPVECFLDQNRPSRGAGGVRFVVRAKTALRPSFKDAKKTQKSRSPKQG